MSDEPNSESERQPPRDLAGEAVDVLIRAFADSIDADAALLFAAPEGGGRPLVLAACDRHQPALKIPWTKSGFVARTLRARSAIIELGPLTSSAGANGNADGANGPLVGELGAPVRTEARLLGAIYASFATPPVADSGRLCWTADSYARAAALCLADDPRLAQALGASRLDSLTGCLTYAALVEALEAEVERSRRHAHPLSCCFIDLDGFKLVNDGNGHLEGNRVLAVVGPALTAAGRRYDVVGRFGGDEFVVVLPETDARAARGVAERLRAGVRSAIAAKTAAPVDVSLGVAEWSDEDTATDLLGAADGALGAAKRNGGAQVVTLGQTDRRFDGLLELTREVMRDRNHDPDRR